MWQCRHFEFTLATEAVPDVTAATQRLQVQAAAATVQLAYGGKLIVTTSGLTAQAFKVLPHQLVWAAQSASVSSLLLGHPLY